MVPMTPIATPKSASMRSPLPVWRIAFVFLAATFPAIAFALDRTFEGKLEPDNRDPPIPIVVELREVGTYLAGSVKMSAPLKASVPMEAGSSVAGTCKLSFLLSKTLTLRLLGKCDLSTFNGIYTIFDSRRRNATEGRFHLVRKGPESAKSEGTPGAAPVTGSTAACLKANAQCLASCPHNDESAEFMCTNHCRTKLRTCKGQLKKAPVEAE
jgi:hypothetical protein